MRHSVFSPLCFPVVKLSFQTFALPAVVLETWQDHHLADPIVRICKCCAHLFVCAMNTHLIASISLQGDLHVLHIKFVFWFKPADGGKSSALSGTTMRNVRGDVADGRQNSLSSHPRCCSLIWRCVTLAFRLSLFPPMEIYITSYYSNESVMTELIEQCLNELLKQNSNTYTTQ